MWSFLYSNIFTLQLPYKIRFSLSNLLLFFVSIFRFRNHNKTNIDIIKPGQNKNTSSQANWKKLYNWRETKLNLLCISNQTIIGMTYHHINILFSFYFSLYFKYINNLPCNSPYTHIPYFPYAYFTTWIKMAYKKYVIINVLSTSKPKYLAFLFFSNWNSTFFTNSTDGIP